MPDSFPTFIIFPDNHVKGFEKELWQSVVRKIYAKCRVPIYWRSPDQHFIIALAGQSTGLSFRGAVGQGSPQSVEPNAVLGGCLP